MAVTALLAASCRGGDERNSTASGRPVPSGVPTPAHPGADGASEPAPETAAPAPAGAGPVAPAARSPAGTGPARRGSSAAPPPAGPDAGGGKGPSIPPVAGPDADGGKASLAPEPGAAAPTPGGAARSPVVLASVGTISGPAGTALRPLVEGAQLWVRHVNERGGLNGHPVKLLLYDDGGLAARHRAQVQEAVERRGAVAFLANAEGITGRESVEYHNAKRVPVIGTTGATPWSYTSPMYFPQASDGDPLIAGFLAAVADQVVATGRTKLGTLICLEIPQCDTADRIFAETAPGLGFDHVYRGRASFTQPDFAAQCLRARDAGADVLFILLDIPSVRRVQASCARHAYRPRLGVSGASVQENMKDDPNLDGLIASSWTFPYFQSGTPATDEFQAAFAAHGAGLTRGVLTSAGWTAGKLLEKAAARLPEPPTSAAILAGLWTMTNDTLGGLTLPLTFVANQPARPRGCWFNMAVRDGAWRSPDGYALHCLDAE